MWHLMTVHVKENDDDTQIFYMSLTPPAGGQAKYRDLNKLMEQLMNRLLNFFNVFIYLTITV